MTSAAPSIRCWWKNNVDLARRLGVLELSEDAVIDIDDVDESEPGEVCVISTGSQGEPLSVTFADYLLPMLHDVPAPDILITEDAPSPLNPLGLKGAGEGGVNAVGAAIASAIDDAIGQPGAIDRLPVTPARLKALLNNKE